VVGLMSGSSGLLVLLVIPFCLSCVGLLILVATPIHRITVVLCHLRCSEEGTCRFWEVYYYRNWGSGTSHRIYTESRTCDGTENSCQSGFSS